MARSQQSYNKKENEKKRKKKREEKQKKKDARKLMSKEKSTGIQFAYVDQFGNLTDTPPDPADKIKVEADSIEISVPKMTEEDREKIDPIRTGKVSYFDTSKGFGFIIDSENSEKYFTHVSGLIDTIEENDEVTFELEKGMKGMNAVNVKLK
jgi:cold shock CspA family protein